jgi:hypothetical protein
MEFVNATMVFLYTRVNVSLQIFAHSIVISTSIVDAVSVMLDFLLSTDNAVIISIVELMVILSMANVIAMMDISGFLDLASPAEPIKHTTVLYVNALLDTIEMLMETVSNPTLSPTATQMKDTIHLFKPVSASKELNTLEDRANPFQLAQ